jgi:hypothetical protein
LDVKSPVLNAAAKPVVLQLAVADHWHRTEKERVVPLDAVTDEDDRG